MLAQARELLQRLEALDTVGRSRHWAARWRPSPCIRVSPTCCSQRAHGAVPLAAELAALLSERDLMRRAGAPRDPDMRTRLEILRREPGALSAERGALQRVQRNAAQFQRLASGRSEAARHATASTTVSPGVLLALAFPDRIAKRRTAGTGRYLLANGRGAAFPGATGLGAEEFLVAVELDDREREARIDLAAPLQLAELENLFGAQITTSEQVEWDERSGAVQALRTRRYGALVIETRALQAVPPALAAQAMLAGVRQLGIAALPWDARCEICRRDLNSCGAWSALPAPLACVR